MITLNFDLPFPRSAAAPADLAKLAGQVLDRLSADEGRKFVDDDDRLAPAMGRFPPQDNPALNMLLWSGLDRNNRSPPLEDCQFATPRKDC